MWKVLRVFKHYSTPQQLRVFSTSSHNKDCEGNDDCDTFGNLDKSGITKLQSVVQTAINKYPIDKRLNEFVQFSPSDIEESIDCSTYSHFQKLHSFDEKELQATSNLGDIVNHSSKKYLLAKLKKTENTQNKKSSSNTFQAFDPDGTVIEISQDDTNFRSVSHEQYTPYVFHRKMERLLQEKKFHDAIAVFEKEMPERKVHPDTQIYGLSIGIYAKWGYTKKAFDTYEKMKKEGAFISKRSITSLFNACALSPWPKTDGLTRAINLRNQLHHSGYTLNNTQYNAMIKAFGRAGATETAFEIIDEMLYKGYTISTDNLNFLLQACLSDKEAGFRHSLMVWKKMRSMRITPDIYSYNLFLRCVRDCNAGTGDLFKDLTGNNEQSQVKFSDTNNVNNQIRPISNNTSKNILKSGNVRETNTDNILPGENSNLPVPVMFHLLSNGYANNEIIGITNLHNCEQRFSLVGGFKILMRNMKRDKVKPTEHTFGLLIKLIPSTEEDEETLIKYMEEHKVTPSISTINQLITKRCRRKKFQLAKDTLEYLTKYGVAPTALTFRALAPICLSSYLVRSFFSDMKTADIKLNHSILHAMLDNCVKHSRYSSVLTIMHEVSKVNLRPETRTIEILENGRNNIRNKILLAEKNGNSSPIPDAERKFLLEYKQWLRKTEMMKQEHPWTPYGYQAEAPAKNIHTSAA